MKNISIIILAILFIGACNETSEKTELGANKHVNNKQANTTETTTCNEDTALTLQGDVAKAMDLIYNLDDIRQSEKLLEKYKKRASANNKEFVAMYRDSSKTNFSPMCKNSKSLINDIKNDTGNK